MLRKIPERILDECVSDPSEWNTEADARDLFIQMGGEILRTMSFGGGGGGFVGGGTDVWFAYYIRILGRKILKQYMWIVIGGQSRLLTICGFFLVGRGEGISGRKYCYKCVAPKAISK